MTGHVAILMATRDGQAHLAEQLASIATQTHADWSLYVSDDGSTDRTLGIVAEFSDSHPGRVRVFKGPGQGAAMNFLSLLVNVPLPDGAFLAWCDQDDVWVPDRLARAVAAGEGAAPCLYASRYQLLLPDGSLGVCSARLRKAPTFGNALVQNPLPGHTMVANPAACSLLRRGAPAAVAASVPFHDWWTCQLLMGAGAKIAFDDVPGVQYRQHGGNVIGARGGLAAAADRFRMILDGRFSNWLDRNDQALGQSSCLTEDAQSLLDRFRSWRATKGARPPLSALGIWRQDRPGAVALQIATALRKI